MQNGSTETTTTTVVEESTSTPPSEPTSDATLEQTFALTERVTAAEAQLESLKLALAEAPTRNEQLELVAQLRAVADEHAQLLARLEALESDPEGRDVEIDLTAVAPAPESSQPKVVARRGGARAWL